MIDIHSHILPGVDDGAGSLEEALEICRVAVEDGTRVMVATPHLRHERWWNGDRNRLETIFERLRAAVAERFGDDLEVRLGGEIAVYDGCLDEVDRLPDGALLSLGGTRALLLELPYHPIAGPDPVELVHETRVAGYRPILAHPERIAWLAGDDSLVHALVRHGALLQLTAMSVTGALGRRLAEVSHHWLDEGLVHLIASDAHDPELRRPGLGEARDTVARLWGDEAARALVVDNPQAVLDDRPLAHETLAAPPADASSVDRLPVDRLPVDGSRRAAASARSSASASPASVGSRSETSGLARVLSFLGRGD